MKYKVCLLLAGISLGFSLPVYAATARGSVVDTDKKPVAGATVFILSSEDNPPVKVQTGADGSWTADVPAPKLPEGIEIPDEATKEMLKKFVGMVFVVAPQKAFAQGTAMTDKPLEIQVYPSATIGGVVQDAKGALLPGVKVRLQAMYFGTARQQGIYIQPQIAKLLEDVVSTQTDAAGHWQLGGVRADAQANVLVDDERFGLNTTSAQANSQNAVLKALPGATLKGRIVFPDGSPAPGIRVYGSSNDLKTDADGRFALTRLPSGNPWYQVSDPKSEWILKADRNVSLEEGEVRDLGDLQLSKGLLLKGKVVDEEGKGIAGARVSNSTGAISDTSDKDGNFKVRSLGGRTYLWTQKEGYLELSNEQRQFDVDGALDEQTVPPLVLKRGVYLTGTVVDANGKPAAGAPLIGGERYVNNAPETKVEEDGTFRLGPLAPGATITLQTSDEWAFAKEQKLTVPSLKMAATAPKLNLTLQKIKLQEAKGRVISSDGKPVPNVVVHIKLFLNTTKNSWQDQEVISDDKGAITLSSLRPEQTPEVDKLGSEGTALVSVPTAKRVGESWNLGDIVVTALDGQIKGVVLGADEKPVVGAKVALINNFTPKIITTDAEGRFNLDKLPRGEVTIGVAEGHNYTLKTVNTGEELSLRLENRAAPTQADGIKLLQGKVGGNSGYLVATAVPQVSPEGVLSIIKRSGDNKPDPTAMAVVLGAIARRTPEVGATWGVAQWEQIKNRGVDYRVGFTSSAALARVAFPVNPKFTASWLDEELAKLNKTDFSAEAADKYFVLAGVAALLKRPNATAMVDLGLTAADHSVLGKTRQEKLDTWGTALCNSPELLERLMQEMEPTQRILVLSGAVQGLASTDVEGAQKLLEQIAKLRETPEVKADDAQKRKDRENNGQWQAMSIDAVNDARRSIIAALSNQPGPAAMVMAQLLSEEYYQAPALIYVAQHHFAAGRTADGLAALKAMPDSDADNWALGASLALPFDGNLAKQMIQKASQKFQDRISMYADDSYRPSGAEYDLYFAQFSPDEARLRIESEWAWRKNQLAAKTNKSSDSNNEERLRELAIAMAGIDLPHALEMLRSLTENPQQNDFAETNIGLYLATNGQTMPLNPWQYNQF